MRFCTYCGQPLDPVTQECPVCGGYKTLDLTDRFIDSLKSNFRSFLMLLLCVLSSASVLLSMLESDNLWFSIFKALIPISLWVTYFAACSSKQGMSLFGIRFTSVLITILRVLMWIVIAVLLVLAIILVAVPSFVSSFVSYAELLYPGMSDTFALISDSVLVIGVLAIVIDVLLAIVNIFFFGCISKATKSIIDSFKTGTNHLRKLKGTAAWLIIIGIFALIMLFVNFSFGTLVSVISIFISAFLAGKIGNTTSVDEI
ncbi:MAG: hypothetical protein E7456_00860 [Ruminococcaceae bacterium]|nr:hypothetical protein [Oscillospiraceae bacterium]